MAEHEWLSSLKQYEGADNKKSVIQLSIAITLFFAIVTAMFAMVTMDVPYWTVLLLSVPAAGFHIKIFIILHDCSHNSFHKSTRACSITGTLCGIITLTPFFDWQRSHSIHHASVSNLDKRGTGDVWTMTVDEYRSASLFVKIQYRIFRNPVFLFGVAPVLLFLVIYRLPHKNMRKKDLLSILFVNIIIALTIAAALFTVGIIAYIKVLLPIIVMSGFFGMWLFFIQHQFKNVYWAHSVNWDPVKAAMAGSSFYRLPAVLRWFSGSIGYHHIHHLKPRIPNYKLKKCYDEIPELHEITPITLFSGFRSLFLYLWDEKTGELVNFSALKNKS